jgi:hypothetical protein
VYALVGVFAVVAVARLVAGHPNLRAGSVEDDGAAVRITSVPAAYTATYRVEDRSGRNLVVTTERYWVRRPFDSRIETYSSSGRFEGLRQSAFGVLVNQSPSSEPLNIAVPPSLASGDLRLDAALPAAVAGGAALRRERRRVYGRPCQVYRFGGPVSAGTLTAYRPPSVDYADVCVDAHGIVLEEAWTSRDRLIRRRVAVHLSVNPPIDETRFAITLPPSAASLQGSVKRIPPPRRWTLAAPPSGFESLGSYAVAVPAAAIAQPGGGPAAAPVSTTDVYVNGPQLVIVDQDPSLVGFVAGDARPIRNVDLSPLHAGQLVLDGRLNEVRGATPDGSYVRILGTLPPEDLVALARSMVKP